MHAVFKILLKERMLFDADAVILKTTNILLISSVST